MNARKSWKSIGPNARRKPPNQVSQNICKTKLKQHMLPFLTLPQHQNYQYPSGFVSFFENIVFANASPFPAARNQVRCTVLRHRPNVVKKQWFRLIPGVLACLPRGQDASITQDVCEKLHAACKESLRVIIRAPRFLLYAECFLSIFGFLFQKP